LIVLDDLNFLAILVAAIASMALGALWYSPLLFGNAWLQELGKDADDLGSPLPAMIGSAVSCLVSAICVAIFVQALNAESVVEGAVVGLLCGLGLVAMSMLSDSLFSGWGWRLYFIQMGYRAVYLALMGSTIGGWPT